MTKKTSKKKTPNKRGRPSKYTQGLADKLCEELAMGRSMRTVCKPDSMPSMQTVFSWLRTKPDFLEQYERAKQEAADALVDEIMDIADDGTNDWMEKRLRDGTIVETLNTEHVQRSRLRVDARKWVASKLKPKKYGERVQHANDPDNPMPSAIITKYE